MDYQKFVNNASFTIFVAVVLVLVTIVCIIFLKNGWKEAERLGVSKEELKKIVINCIGISLVPSIPIVLSVIVMVPVLGVALPWLRTSVIGSANNELISATMAAKNPALKWLKDYAFPLTILFGLVLSMIITPLLA